MTPTPQYQAPETDRPALGRRARPARVGWLLIPAGLLAAGGVALLAWPPARLAAPTAVPSLPPPPVPDGPPPPTGYSVAGAATEGFRINLPGTVTPEWRVRKTITPDGTVASDPASAYWLFRSGGDVATEAYSVRLPAPVPADALWAELVRVDPFVTSPSLNLEGKRPVTLGGRPALEVRVVENVNWMYEHHPKEVAKPDEQVIAALQAKAKRWVYTVAADDRRVYVVRLETAGRDPDPEVAAAVTGSFQFLPAAGGPPS